MEDTTGVAVAVDDTVCAGVQEPVAVSVADALKVDDLEDAGLPETVELTVDAGLPETDDVCVETGLLDKDELIVDEGLLDTDELTVNAGLYVATEVTVASGVTVKADVRVVKGVLVRVTDADGVAVTIGEVVIGDDIVTAAGVFVGV